MYEYPPTMRTWGTTLEGQLRPGSTPDRSSIENRVTHSGTSSNTNLIIHVLIVKKHEKAVLHWQKKRQRFFFTHAKASDQLG